MVTGDVPAEPGAFEAAKSVAMLRGVEVEWLADRLGESVANLGYPVGMGVAPKRESLLKAANFLFDRYAGMIEMAQRSFILSQPGEDE